MSIVSQRRILTLELYRLAASRLGSTPRLSLRGSAARAAVCVSIVSQRRIVTLELARLASKNKNRQGNSSSNNNSRSSRMCP